MGRYIIEAKDYLKIEKENKSITLIDKKKFESFNEDILGLGKIEVQSDQVNAISVLFDLEGFTTFCKQIDPQLAVPEYLSDFLKWLFAQVRTELIQETHNEGYKTYSELPFLSKFMGDGMLFLWNTDGLSDIKIRNIVVSMYEICQKYKKDFLKNISKKVTNPPTKLRCGIARGAIYSVGNGNDYVGPCINMSARLQKLNSLSFCFSRRGLNPEGNSYLKGLVVTKKTDIRGIGSDELVCILKTEYEKLSPDDIKKFIDP